MTDVAHPRSIVQANPTLAGRALLDTFSAIRIINLKSRDDRRREVTAEFARLGLAIDGEKIGFHDASRFSDANPFPSIGAKGCYDSHLKILEEALDRKIDNILILEDDCDFVGNIEELLPRAAAALRREHWDLFFGGHEDLACDETSPDPIQKIEQGTWIRGTHFVAFRARAIQALVPFLHDEIELLARDPVGGSRGIDAAYTHFGRKVPGYSFFIAWPKLGYQRPSRTDISAPSALDRVPFFNLITAPARRIKRFLKKRLT
ncbi:glycosyltransferase family 25 protein [Bradyrhizobium sp. USDA 4486]